MVCGAGLVTNSIFFLFPFREKSLICLEGKSMTPHRGNTVPPSNSLVSVSDPRLASYVASGTTEIHRSLIVKSRQNRTELATKPD